MKYHFYFKKKKLSDKLKLLGLGIWQTFFFVLFFKMNEVSLTFQGKQLAVFVASDKPWFLKWKLEFWNTRMYHQQLNSFAVLTLLMGTVGIFTNVLFWYCTTKYFKPLEYPPNTVNQYLSNDKHQCSKVLDEWKAHWEGEVDLCVQPEPAPGTPGQRSYEASSQGFVSHNLGISLEKPVPDFGQTSIPGFVVILLLKLWLSFWRDLFRLLPPDMAVT